MTQTLYLQKIPFLNVKNKHKSIEIRQFKGFIKTILPQTIINLQYQQKKIPIFIKTITLFDDLITLLNNVTLKYINPNLITHTQSSDYFNQYYKQHNKQKHKYIAIYFINLD